jgi:hypothetical protein
LSETRTQVKSQSRKVKGNYGLPNRAASIGTFGRISFN